MFSFSYLKQEPGLEKDEIVGLMHRDDHSVNLRVPFAADLTDLFDLSEVSSYLHTHLLLPMDDNVPPLPVLTRSETDPNNILIDVYM